MFLFKKNSSVHTKYKPMTLLYIAIIVVCIVVRFIPVSSGYSSVDDALNDLAVGAIASTWVAWLIDIATCKKKNEDRTEKERMIFSEYTGCVFDFCYYVSRRSTALALNADARTLKEWLFILANISNYKCESPSTTREQNYLHLVERIKEIKTTIQSLQRQHTVLVESDIVDTDDFQQHAALQVGLCDTICDCLESSPISEAAINQANDMIEILVDNCRTFFPTTVPELFTWVDAKG